MMEETVFYDDRNTVVAKNRASSETEVELSEADVKHNVKVNVLLDAILPGGS